MPSLLAYEKKYNRLPVHLTFGLACLIRFYKGEWKGKELPINDEENIVKRMKGIWKIKDHEAVAKEALQTTDFWGEDLSKIEGLVKKTAQALQLMEAEGIEKGFEKFVADFASV